MKGAAGCIREAVLGGGCREAAGGGNAEREDQLINLSSPSSQIATGQ